MASSANCGSLTVEGTSETADLRIDGCPTPVPSNASADQEITVEPTIENSGDTEAYYEVYVLVGETEVVSESVVTYPDSPTTIPLRFTPSDHNLSGGEYDISVHLRDVTTSAAPVRSYSCSSCGTPTETETESESGSGGLLDSVTTR